MSTDQSLPIRLPEDVKSAANIAGIIPSNQPIQLLHFNATTNTDDIQLLQLTSDITESLKNGQRYDGTVVYWYSGILVQWYTGTVVYWYSGILVQWYTGTVVFWYVYSSVY